MMQFLSKFLYVLQGKRKALLLMIFLFLIVSVLEAIGTGMVGPFMSLATNPAAIAENPWLSLVYQKLKFGSHSQFLLAVGSLVVVIFYLKAFLGFQAQKYIFNFSFSQQGELSARLMHLYLSAPYTFHLGRNSAVLIQNIINETYTFANGLMIPLLVSISNVVIILALVLLLVKTNALASLIIAGIVLISFLFFQRFKGQLALWGKEGSESRTEMIRSINHGIGGIKEIRIIGCEDYFEQKLQEQAKRFGRSVSLAVSFSNLPRYVVEALLVTFLIVFTFSFIMTNRGNVQNLSSVLGIFALASIRLLPSVSNLLSSINGIKSNSYSLDKLYSDFKELDHPEFNGSEELEEKSFLSSAKRTIAFAEKITLDQVTYRYSNASKNAIENIYLEIKKGQSIGLIGKSGAGKTTLIDVILGLLLPQSGDITVDGYSIYNNLRFWQNMVGYVPQSIFLTDDTLERNIALGLSDDLIDQDRLWKAIKTAQLSELVEQLPQGIDTIIGERGVLLSGGQRQRIGIARALYHEREILVFDEATSALDNETEELVTEAIQSLSGIKTMIIIAHRLSTVEHCDRIYLVEQGKITKSGSYEEIVN